MFYVQDAAVMAVLYAGAYIDEGFTYEGVIRGLNEVLEWNGSLQSCIISYNHSN